jgi:hypothetical protein
MQGFHSAGGLQRFTAVFSTVRNLFVPPASKHCALATHLHRLTAFAGAAPPASARQPERRRNRAHCMLARLT